MTHTEPPIAQEAESDGVCDGEYVTARQDAGQVTMDPCNQSGPGRTVQTVEITGARSPFFPLDGGYSGECDLGGGGEGNEGAGDWMSRPKGGVAMATTTEGRVGRCIARGNVKH
jgi:hypothetical protein